MMGKRGLAALVAACALCAIPAAAAADDGVTSPNGKAFGRTLDEWHGLWWQHVLELPLAENPLAGNGEHCVTVGRVLIPFILDGSTCTVSKGTGIFWLAFSLECSTVEPPPFAGGPDLGSLLACARAFNDAHIRTVGLAVDGVTVRRFKERFRLTTPLLSVDLPDDNLLGVPPQDVTSAAEGWAAMVKPLEPGEHELTFDVTSDGEVTPPDQAGSVRIVVTDD